MENPVKSRRPQLTVIEGGGEGRPKLLRLPPTVSGPSPFARGMRIGYRIATGDVRRAYSANRRQPVLDLWAMVLGQLPPVANISRYNHLTEQLKAQAVENAHAAFRGVRRPVGNDPHGFDHVVFITIPRVHFRYVPDMVCVVKADEIPDDVVLATYVQLDFPHGRPNAAKMKVPVGGVITHWELVERDGELPVRSSERYRQRLW